MRRSQLALLAIAFVSCGGPSATATSSPAPSSAAPATTAVATAAPSTARPATTAPLPAFQDATLVGTWNNTTFGSTGPATFDIKVNAAAAKMTVTITLGGNVFGAPAPAPESFTLPLSAAGATFSGKSKTFGDVTATLKGGTMTFKGDNVPGGRVKSIDGTGTYTPTSLSLAYNVALADGTTAKGMVTLKKS